MVERIDILITERGGRVVRRSLEDIATSATTGARAVDLFRRALLLLGGANIVRQLITLADTFTNIQNRLRTVTDSTLELNGVTDELFAITQRTRSAFEATAETYTRVALATRNLGLSQQTTLEFTESLNQAVILSGATTQEAAAGLLQLGQGLASGALRGDELRSVLEQIPVVADVIAESLGVTRGELRDLGSDGAITADVVITAFQEAREELAGRFAETIPTVGQAFVVLRNAVIQTIGEFDTANGITRALAQAIITLAENFEVVARVALGVAGSLAILAGARGIGAVITAVRALTIAIATNPIGAIAVGLTFVVTQLIAFADQINVTADGLSNLADLAQAVVELISDGFRALAEIVGPIITEIFTALQVPLPNIDFSLRGLLTLWAQTVDNILGLAVGVAAAVVEAFRNIPAGLERIFVLAFNAISNRFTRFINNIIDGLNLLPGVAIEPFEAIQIEAETTFGDIGTNIANAFSEGFDSVGVAEGLVNNIFDRAEQIAQNRIADNRLIELAQQQLDLSVAAPGAGAGAGAGAAGGRRSLREQNEELERLRDLLREITGDQAGLAQRATDLRTLFDQGLISLQQFTEAARDLNVEITALDNSFQGGIANGFARLTQQANDLGQSVSDFVVGSFDQATEAIVNFARTGEADIRQFFQNLFSQLLRIATNQLITQLLGSLGGGFSLGSLLGGGGGAAALPGFQTGGSFMVGGSGGPDSQLAAFRVSPGERVDISTPAQQRAQQAAPMVVQAPAPNVTVNVGAEQISNVLNTNGAGDDFVVNAMERNRTTLRQIANSS